MSSSHLDTSLNPSSSISTPTPTVTVITTTTAVAAAAAAAAVTTTPPDDTRRLLDADPCRLSMNNTLNISPAGAAIHQRRISIVNQHQRRNSQLRKASFTTSILVCD